MTDPFADGMPVGDYHHWERPQGDPCPHCQCCTTALCELAIEKNAACNHYSDGSSFDLTACPCWRQGSAARVQIQARAAQQAVDVATRAPADPAADVSHTAYPSGPAGLWAVWDHVHDQAVRTDLDEQAARQLAAALRASAS